MKNDHRFFSLTHKLEFMVDDFGDDRVLCVNESPNVHPAFQSHDTRGSCLC